MSVHNFFGLPSTIDEVNLTFITCKLINLIFSILSLKIVAFVIMQINVSARSVKVNLA